MSSPDGFCDVCRQSFQVVPVLVLPQMPNPLSPRLLAHQRPALRGPLRVIWGRGISRGDTYVILLTLGAILSLCVYGWFFF